MESYIFSTSFFFPSLSLSSGMGSVPGRANFISHHSFFFFPLSPLFNTYFFSSSNFFLPLFPCLPSIFLSPIIFPFLFFILILFLPLFFFLFPFSSLFSPFLLLFFSLVPQYIILLIAPPFPLLSLSHVNIVFSFSLFNNFSFSYLFHLLAKRTAIK